ncbi:zinc transporter 77C [Musca autumnalis]|uniref:zinc transporter 77C n=1 Tax=Musca autumnalis TaxID=221902 RepID=UPI003CF6AB2B
MPNINFLNRFQPAPLYIVLFLSICYFSVQLILSHLTHALTLLMASYHMLCNILALAGSIVTIKHNELHNSDEEKRYSETNLAKKFGENTDNDTKQLSATDGGGGIVAVVQVAVESETQLRERKRREQKTRNTFGWARIEILTMLIICITLASLSFSLLVEALQTLVHIDHQDSMHLPVHVMILGVVGLLLNGFTYILIGGYTLHQGNFLHINPMGKVITVESSNITVETNGLTKSPGAAAVGATAISSDHQLRDDLKAELGKVHYHTRREGPSELLRDVSSTIFVIVCAVIVHFAKDKEHTAKFIDPVLSIFSCFLVVALSYPYMKEACMILLQTVPGTIDMDNFERNLVTKFPQIVSYHDLHIWQLSSHSYIATIHIIFKTPKLYEKTIDDLRSHFHEHRIAHVTIQPEFQAEGAAAAIEAGTVAKNSMECLMQCQNPDCADKMCCKDSHTDLREVSVCDGHGKKSKKHHHHGHSHGGGHGHSHAHGHSHKTKPASHKHGKKCGNSKENNIAPMQMENQEVPEEAASPTCPVQQVTCAEENHQPPSSASTTSTAIAKTEISSVVCENTEASNGTMSSSSPSSPPDSNADNDDSTTTITKC